MIGIEKPIAVKRSFLILANMINYIAEHPMSIRRILMINRSTLSRLQALESSRITPLTNVNRLTNEELAEKMLYYNHLWTEEEEPEAIRYERNLMMISSGAGLTLAEKVDHYLPTCTL
jgi:hypothetical protein